jgi:multidrug efflux system membrane fusion protein
MQDKLTETSLHDKSPFSPNDPPKKKSSTGIFMLLFLVVLGGVGFYFWRSSNKNAQAATRAANFGGGRGIPVVVAKAVAQDLPITLDGLGSVTAFNTVTVKSRVDGELVEVDFKEGQDVKKGDLLAVIDPRPYQVALAQAQAKLSQDQAQLGDAQRNDARYAQLVKDGVIPQQQYDTQHALAAQLSGSVASDMASIDSAKLNIVYSRITSPISGRIGLRLVDQGNIVHAADANGMLVITQMEPIAVIFTLPEDSLPAVQAGMRRGALQVKAMSRDATQDITTGQLETIDNQIDQTTGTYKLKAVFENKDRALWPNQFVNARLLLETQKNALVVPAAAIQRGAQGTYVYRVKSDKTVEAEPVTIGVSQGNITSIKDGLDLGDAVVTDGQDRLRAGSNVDARTADGTSVAGDDNGGGGGNGGNGGRRRRNGQGGGGQAGGQGGGQGADSQAGGQGFANGQGGGDAASGGGQGKRRFGNGGNGGGPDGQGGPGGNPNGKKFGGKKKRDGGQGDGAQGGGSR